MSTKKDSFTSADSMPIKLIRDLKTVWSVVNDNKIRPVHAQIIPTNRCNLSCEFCSCSAEDRKVEMSFVDFFDIITTLRNLGTRSVTVTGGGEPLLHRQLPKMIKVMSGAEMKVGLVTNGILLDRSDVVALRKLIWCRISHADFRPFTKEYADSLSNVIYKVPNVDWAFSYVLSTDYDIENINKVIQFANEHNFTHVRIVSDLFKPELFNMEEIKRQITVDDSKVIYQGRKDPEQGGPCYIGYLKPLIGADCKVYTCCGAQYALENPSYKMPEELCLGDAKHLKDIIDRSMVSFDGTICKKCYYGNYNRVLKALTTEVQHKDFV